MAWDIWITLSRQSATAMAQQESVGGAVKCQRPTPSGVTRRDSEGVERHLASTRSGAVRSTAKFAGTWPNHKRASPGVLHSGWGWPDHTAAAV